MQTLSKKHAILLMANKTLAALATYKLTTVTNEIHNNGD